MLNNTSSLESENIYHSTKRPTRDRHLGVNPAQIVEKSLVYNCEISNFENWTSEINRVLTSAEGVWIVLDVIFRHVLKYCGCGVFFDVELFQEFVESAALRERRRMESRTVCW